MYGMNTCETISFKCENILNNFRLLEMWLLYHYFVPLQADESQMKCLIVSQIV